MFETSKTEQLSSSESEDWITIISPKSQPLYTWFLCHVFHFLTTITIPIPITINDDTTITMTIYDNKYTHHKIYNLYQKMGK